MSEEAAIDPEEKFEDFFKSFKDQKNELKYRRKIQQLSIENKISIIVDFDDLLRYDAEIARDLLLKPEEVIKAADRAAMTVLELEDREYFEKLKNEDRALFVRFRNLPSINHIPLRKIRSEHIGILVMIDGILTRASEVKPRLVEAAFECLRCHYRNFVRQETTEIIKPIICENTNCRRNGPFRLINEESKFEDWQKIRVQEKPEELPPGQLPRAIDAILTYDLVDSARPGDRVSIIGILRSTPEYAGRTKLSTFKIYLEANYIDITEKELEKTEITPEDEQKILEISRDPEIHNKIIKSIAPSIYGLEDVKEAIALQLFGGVSKVLPDSMKIRGESNILLVGDPGTAKCLAPGALVLMASGEKRRIEELVEENLEKNTNIIDDGYYANGSVIILTMNRRGRIEPAEANIFWKRSAPSYMINIKTEHGKEITVTPTHPFYTTNNGLIFCKEAKELSLEDFIATSRLENTDKKAGLTIIPGVRQLLKKIREERNLQINQMGIPEPLYKKYENGDLEANVTHLKKIIEHVKQHGSSESLQRLSLICETDIFWDRITKIARIKPTSQWVYDLQVPGSNNFIANDFYVHNSQILQYTAQLAPRGLYTSGKGSSAAGLCVAPDTIIVKDETPYEIGKLVEEHLNEGALKIQEGVYKVNPKTEIKIKTINPFKNVDKKVTGLWKIKTPEKLVKILTYTGREITLTPETKMKTLENGLIYWKKAADFTVNDYLAAARRIIYNGKRVNILALIGDDENIEVGVMKTFFKKTLEKLNNKNILENIKNQTISELDKEKHARTVESCDTVKIPLREFIKYSKNAGFSLNYITRYIREYYESGENRLKIPAYLNWGIMYITGLVAGSRIYNKTPEKADRIRFATSSRELINLFSETVKRVFNILPEETENGLELVISSRIIAKILNKAGLATEDNEIIDLSELTLSLREKEMAAFISGLFDYLADISLTREGTPNISISLPNKLIARKIQLALLRYGIIARIEGEGLTDSDKKEFKSDKTSQDKAQTLTINGFELIIYRDRIGSKSKLKREKLEKAVEHLQKTWINSQNSVYNKPPYYKIYTTPLTHKETSITETSSQPSYAPEDLKETDIFWDKVKKIEFSNSNIHQWVYDVTVEDSHSFIANGLLVHNTAAVLKDESGAMALEAGALVLADKGLACLHPNTDIIFNNRIISIEKLFNEDLMQIRYSNGEEIQIAPINGEIKTFNLEKFESTQTESNIIRRKKYDGEIIHIKLNSGFELNLTPDHKLIDGNSITWRSAQEFKVGDYIIAPLKISEPKREIYLFDIIPEDWLVILSKSDKQKLKKIILQNFRSVSEFNKAFNIKRGILSGNEHFKLGKFKEILNYFNLIDEWKDKPIKYARKKMGETLKISKITPELSYLLGVVYGDGTYQINKRGSMIQIKQPIKKKEIIDKLKKCIEKISYRKLWEHQRENNSIIKDQQVSEKFTELFIRSNLLTFIIDYFLKENLKNILELPQNCLKEFIAGAFDSDGYVSIKKSRKKDKKYYTAHIEFLLSDNKKKDLAFMQALRRLDVYSKLLIKKNANIIRITGRADVNNFCKLMKEHSIKVQKTKIPPSINKVSSDSDKLPSQAVSRISKAISNLNKSILVKKGVWSTLYAYNKQKNQPSRIQLEKIRDKLANYLPAGLNNEINTITKRDYFLDKIVAIRKKSYKGFVYDLYVPGFNNFYGNGVWLHNCIDEFDKMNPQDRVAIHEAMEQRTVSIAKAGIIATLNARTSILAAANPALGRYNEYRTPADNIKLPVTLLSRFDLIFIVTDKPDVEKDRKIAEHILSLHRRESVEPPLDIDFLRKYITYAKRNCSPSISPEAAKKIQEFYLEMRKSGEGEDSPVPITARQLEALIRLVEARARMALKKEATVEDTEAVIKLVKSCLHQVGVDKETGKMDIDILMTGAPKSQRDRLSTLLDIISNLEKEQKGTVPLQDVIDRAKEYQLEEGFVKEALQRLLNDGTIFEPEPGYIKRTE